MMGIAFLVRPRSAAFTLGAGMLALTIMVACSFCRIGRCRA
jgi:hypothetical protein